MDTKVITQTNTPIALSEEDSTGQNYVYNFQRYEYKYIIPNNIAHGLIPYIARHMDYDAYSKGGQTYSVHSVYFDSPERSAFYEKIAGIERRHKYRIRAYSKNLGPDDPVFFEVKEKEKDIILKRRFSSTFSQVPEILSQNLSLDDKTFREWKFAILRRNLTPNILIEYDRLAFVPRSPLDLRITLDQNLRYANMKDVADFSAPSRIVEVMKHSSVLEIKFRHFIPRWTLDLIQKYDLRNDAFSKFCESVMFDNKLKSK